jgi:arsenical pump membrane protein
LHNERITQLAVLSLGRRRSIDARRHHSPFQATGIPLVGGLFVLVEGLQRIGVISHLANAVHTAASTMPAHTGWISGAVVAVACNLINNLPAGLIAGSALTAAHASTPIGSAVLVGVDLGPNFSVTGSLATILWLTALRRDGIEVSAWTFLKLGVVVTLPALAAALAAVAICGNF